MNEDDIELMFAPRCARCGSVAEVKVRCHGEIDHEIYLCAEHLEKGDIIIEDYRECIEDTEKPD